MSPELPTFSAELAAKYKLTFPVLNDHGLTIAKAFGLVFTLPDDLRDVYLNMFIRMSIVPDPCGESDRPNNSIEIERGKDDHTFRLDAAPNQVCSRLFDKIDWEAVGEAEPVVGNKDKCSWNASPCRNQNAPKCPHIGIIAHRVLV